jgi:hypothetical protein
MADLAKVGYPNRFWQTDENYFAGTEEDKKVL